MAKQYMVVNEDQILVDMELIFAAIRDSDGDWEQVEQDLIGVMDTIHHMAQAVEGEDATDDK